MRDKPLIIVGDFNQRTDQERGVSHQLLSALRNKFPAHMAIVTVGLGHRGRRHLDHLVSSNDLVAESLSVISKMGGKTELSDHQGVATILPA